VTSIIYIFETSPNTKPLEKNVGGHGILYLPTWKSGGHVPRVPHQIVPMLVLVGQQFIGSCSTQSWIIQCSECEQVYIVLSVIQFQRT